MKTLIWMSSGLVVLLLIASALFFGSRRQGGRKVLAQLVNASGKWTAVVDEVECVNGFSTSYADRVSLFDSKGGENGRIVFSEDALPLADKPRVSWENNTLVIHVSKKATILSCDRSVNGIGVVVRIE